MGKIRSLFQYEGKFWDVLSFVCDICILSIFWSVTSIPLVTIGASTAALDQMVLIRIREGSFRPLSDFFRIFSANLVKSSLVWILYAILIAWLIISTAIFNAMEAAVFGKVLSIIELSFLFVLMLGFRLSFFLQVLLQGNPIKTIVRATRVGLRYFPQAFAVLVLLLCGLQAIVWIPMLLPAFLCFGVAGIAYLQMRLFNQKLLMIETN